MVEVDENQQPSVHNTQNKLPADPSHPVAQNKLFPADPSHPVAQGFAANNSLGLGNLTPLNVRSKKPGARDLQSPLFLPVLQVDPSPTTGARHSIPPFYHSAAAARRSSLLDLKPPSPRTLNIVPTSVEVPFSSPKAPGPSKLQQQHHKQHAHQSLPADPEDQAPKRASPARNTSKGAPSALPPTDAPSQSQQQSTAQHQPPEANGAEAGLLPLQSCTASTSPDDDVKGEELGSAAAAAVPPAAALPPVSAEVPLVEATPQASSKGLLPQLDPQKTLHYAANHDGWQWRKYGEKIVKGSTNPRSYYKCSNQGCPAKKIVERNTEGVIFNTEYKGLHCHPAPATVKAAAKCRTTKPGKAQQAAQAPDPPCVPQESNTPTRRDSEGGNVHFGHGSDPAAAPPTIPRGTAHDGETLFGDWLLAMRQEHSASMWGAEEGDGATATPGRVINFGQRDAAQDLAVAIQNLQSPRPLMDSPSFSGIADRHSFALRHCFGGASPKHSQLQLEQALEAALSPRPLTLNLIQQQQQQQHGQLHSSQQFARPSKRLRHGGNAGTADPSRLQLSSTATDLTSLAPSHSTPFSTSQASDPMHGSQGGGNSHSTEGSDAAGASDIAASAAAAAAAAAAMTAPLPLALPLPGSTAALAASLPMLLGLPCIDPQHFTPHAAAEAAAAAAAAAAFAGGSGICEPSDASPRQGGHQGTGQDGTLSPSHSQPFSQWLEGYVQQQQQQLQQLHQSHRA